MTLQQKKNIDVLAPMLLAGGMGLLYFSKTKNKSWQLLIAVMLVCFAIGYVLTTKITRGIYEKAPPTQLPNDVGLQQCASFNPAPLVDAIHTNAYGWFNFRDLDSYTALAALSNCELGVAYKYWWNKYHAEKGESLAQAIAAESGFLEQKFSTVQNLLAARFSSLNLA